MCGVMFGIHTQVATFILQKILLDDTGLAYICQTYERFSHVAMVLVSEWVHHSGAHIIYVGIYSEYLLICRNSISKNMVD